MKYLNRIGRWAFWGMWIGGMILFVSPMAYAQEQPLTFSTWEGFEVDKCASIWLIKRFIDSEAVIEFYPKGDMIEKGVPFDTPDAEFRRYHNRSTYESLMDHYKLDDPKLTYIGKIIHDIEVNVWERKVMKETRNVQNIIIEIIRSSSEPADVIKKSSAYFDALYERLHPTDYN